MKRTTGSSVWNVADLTNIMAALATATVGVDNDDWRRGYVAALTALALAIGVDRQLLLPDAAAVKEVR